MDESSALRMNRNGQWEFIEGQLIKDGDQINVLHQNGKYPVTVKFDHNTQSYFFTALNQRFYLKKSGIGVFRQISDINNLHFSDMVKAEKARLDNLQIKEELRKSLFENYKWSLSSGQIGQPGNYGFQDCSQIIIGCSNFEKANLDHTDFSNSNLDGANLHRSMPWEAIFWKTSLLGANLSYIQAWDVSFKDSQISGADFYEATLSEAFFNNTIAAGTNFAYANLESATFLSANLCAANFYKADLRKVDFTNANLSRADLREAKLEDAKISKQQLLSAITE